MYIFPTPSLVMLLLTNTEHQPLALVVVVPTLGSEATQNTRTDLII